jgi:hypothetical protein
MLAAECRRSLGRGAPPLALCAPRWPCPLLVPSPTYPEVKVLGPLPCSSPEPQVPAQGLGHVPHGHTTERGAACDTCRDRRHSVCRPAGCAHTPQWPPTSGPPAVSVVWVCQSRSTQSSRSRRTPHSPDTPGWRCELVLHTCSHRDVDAAYEARQSHRDHKIANFVTEARQVNCRT